MKTIAKIFIGALIATGGIAFYMNWKKKQAVKSTSAPIPDIASGGASNSSAATTTPTPATTSATSTSAPVTSTGFAPAATNPAASTTSTTAGKYSFQFAVKENSKNQTIISYQPKTDTFVNGQKVKIVTGPSALIGKTGTIWYIYDFTSGGRLTGAGQNLYLDIPWSDSFAGTVGTFDKV